MNPSANVDVTRTKLDHAQQNAAMVRRLFEQGINAHDVGLIEASIGPDYTGPPGAPPGAKGPAAFVAPTDALRGAFPDIRYEVLDVVADDRLVAIRWRWTGTHRGTFRSYAPTGASITNTGLAIFEVQGGKIVRGTLETDRLGFLQQIGVVPADAVLQRTPSRGATAE